MFRRRMIALCLAIVAAVVVVAPTLAAKGGNKRGDPPCTISGSTVSASGLPTDQVINFMISDNSGTSGWVLGYTSDGNWSVSVPAANGATTYEFASRTWGPNGSKYTTFASCSA
jgi:hypothetical protein